VTGDRRQNTTFKRTMSMDFLYSVTDTHTRAISALGYHPTRRELMIGCEGICFQCTFSVISTETQINELNAEFTIVISFVKGCLWIVKTLRRILGKFYGVFQRALVLYFFVLVIHMVCKRYVPTELILIKLSRLY
jgi:hypothetical protein